MYVEYLRVCLVELFLQIVNHRFERQSQHVDVVHVFGANVLALRVVLLAHLSRGKRVGETEETRVEKCGR